MALSIDKISAENRNRISFLLAFLCLAVGGLIYIGGRSDQLLINKGASSLGITSTIETFRQFIASCAFPKWVVYSIPDGLWMSAYLLTLNAIWKNKMSLAYKIFAYTMPIIAIGLEILQTLPWFPGTFDKIDLLCYIIPVLILTPLRHEF